MLTSARVSVAEDATEKPVNRYETRKKHDPNGIGKFYMGREIAHVVSGIDTVKWLDRDTREQEERTTVMVKALNLEPGSAVADIGAGSGRISLLMADAVGEKGKVFAVDVQQEMLDVIAEKLQQLEVHNVKLVKGTEKSPKLKAESIDLALMVDVYHEFKYPYEMMEGIAASIKPGGRVVFVEFRMEDPDVPIKLVHKMSEEQVKREMSPEEFRMKWKETIGVLPWQHIIVFEKQAAEGKDEK
jgi:ubiquinone/menaquinone biosynthesis C-methylase UbiE